MQLSSRALDRTLLLRQHLLERSSLSPLELVGHLIGLQAQDNLPPYLSLAARIEAFDPLSLSTLIESRAVVRFLTLRGTVHVLTRADALRLRSWVQPTLDRLSHGNRQNRGAAHVPIADLLAVSDELLTDGPLPFAELSESLHARFPDAPAKELGHVARERVAILQVPPRGLWRRSGGVVYAMASRWLGAPLAEPDLSSLVRRYLRANGPATAADMTSWSSVTRLGPVFAAMAGELETHTDQAGRTLYDVPGAPLAEEDVEAPVRLLGKYDNVWLSHAGRDRVVTGEKRRLWMGPNGGAGNALLVDGAMEGLWSVEDGRVRLDLWRKVTRAERSSLDEEIERVETLLRVPPA
ncbi:MAG: winged helix DNA-binding domain-containing protein [Actinomycetota bacterium]|nr:winged helix DNA-binding domain-containing protein [Actinomycetota bacterium]